MSSEESAGKDGGIGGSSDLGVEGFYPDIYTTWLLATPYLSTGNIIYTDMISPDDGHRGSPRTAKCPS